VDVLSLTMMMDVLTTTKLERDIAGTILIERITHRLNIVSLQSSENYSVLIFAFIWDFYWCHECVSSTPTDTYQISNMQCLLF
jgi:hypothetical protein